MDGRGVGHAHRVLVDHLLRARRGAERIGHVLAEGDEQRVDKLAMHLGLVVFGAVVLVDFVQKSSTRWTTAASAIMRNTFFAWP